MSEERKRILKMLAEGKITADEAESLLSAIENQEATPAPEAVKTTSTAKEPKYLRVLVEDSKNAKVNVRVPIQILRFGVKLASLIPEQAQSKINEKLRENGVQFDIASIKPQDISELIQHLAELTVDVDGGNGDRVRVFCE